MIFHRGFVQPADALRFFFKGRTFAARGGTDTSPRWCLGFFFGEKGSMATTTKLFQWNYGCLGFSGENSPTILLLIFQWYPEDTPKSLTASFPLKSSIPKYERIVFQAAFLEGDVKLRWCTLKKKVSWKSVPIHNIEWNPAFQPWLTVEKQLSLMDRDKHYPLWQCLGNTFMINDVLIKKIHRWEFLTASFWDGVISKLKPSFGKIIQQDISTSYCAFTALRLRGC